MCRVATGGMPESAAPGIRRRALPRPLAALVNAGIAGLAAIALLPAGIATAQQAAQASPPGEEVREEAGRGDAQAAEPSRQPGAGPALQAAEPSSGQPAEPSSARSAERPGPSDEDATEPGELRVYEEIQVTGRGDDLVGVADSATEGVTGREDLARRPILRTGELLETVPGVIITQHSGSGKANQYFLRGFNLDHGTDFRVTVDGVPVNMPSHGHGQGYSDLNFLIPELVDAVRYEKGAYAADHGDFSTAGAAEIELVDTLDHPLAGLTSGSHGYGRAVAAGSVAAAGGTLLGGVELARDDGPWVRPERLQRASGLLRFRRGDAANGLTLTAMGYDGSWSSTDQIPARAVAAGQIDRFEGIDPSDGGASSRYSLAGELRRGSGAALTRLSVFALRYDLDLYSNFTYFLDDPVRGDQFEQTDRRTVAGADLRRDGLAEWWGRQVETAYGLQVRHDRIANGLFHTQARQRLATTREDRIGQLTAGPYGEARVRWNGWLRTVAGLRADYLRVDVASDLAANSGTRDDALLSPKLSVLLGPWRRAELYANAGWGFHSNDARGATIAFDPRTGEPVGRVQPLVRAKSAELGLRTQPLSGLSSSLGLFRLDLDSELVFVGDAGGTEAGRPSRRTGIELANFWRPGKHLTFEADLTISRGRFTDGAGPDGAGDHIPGAIERTAALGASFEDLGPWFGALRVRHFGPRPLVEDASVRSRSSTLASARLGYRLVSGLGLVLDIFNLFDREGSDIDYFYASRLPGEPAEGVEDVHFHPAEPRALRLTLDWRR